MVLVIFLRVLDPYFLFYANMQMRSCLFRCALYDSLFRELSLSMGLGGQICRGGLK